MATFIALSVAVAAVRAIRPVLEVLRTRSADLKDQLETAASSVALNVSEGNRRVGKDRQHFFRIAAGSCDEARTAITLADALGHLDGVDLAPALALFDREAALLYRLMHPRR